MAIGGVRVFELVIASGASQSATRDLGRGYAKVIYDCTGAGDSTHFLAARSASGTLRVVRHAVASAMSAPQTATVGSACSGSLVEVDALAGLQFVRAVVTAGVANGATLLLYCSDI